MTAWHLGGEPRERGDKREVDVDVLRIWVENEKTPGDVGDGDETPGGSDIDLLCISGASLL